MRLISSRLTFFYKRILPIFWFGVLIVVLLFSLAAPGPPPIGMVIVPMVMIGVGAVIMKLFVLDLLDQVFDDGDALVLKNRGQEERIPFSDIKNVSYSPFINPPRVVLSLRRPTIFGDKVAFCAPVRIVPFASSAAIDDLIERIDRARRS